MGLNVTCEGRYNAVTSRESLCLKCPRYSNKKDSINLGDEDEYACLVRPVGRHWFNERFNEDPFSIRNIVSTKARASKACTLGVSE